jgi:hypothetical protein
MNMNLPVGLRVFACVQPTDLRRSFDRLAAMVREHLRRDPLGGDLYLFRNRADDRVKLLWHEPSGWWIFSKRLHRGVFRFPGAAPSRSNGGIVRCDVDRDRRCRSGSSLDGARYGGRGPHAAPRKVANGLVHKKSGTRLACSGAPW